MIIIVAAMTRAHVIGKGNQLPWRIPAEMKHFAQLTTGGTVIMGRRTFESIGKPLPRRHNIVLSRDETPIAGVDVCVSIDDALSVAQRLENTIFIIGGAHVYEQFLPLADQMFLSYIKQEYEGNVFFPVFDPHDWIIRDTISYPEFDFVHYESRRRIAQADAP